MSWEDLIYLAPKPDGPRWRKRPSGEGQTPPADLTGLPREGERWRHHEDGSWSRWSYLGAAWEPAIPPPSLTEVAAREAAKRPTFWREQGESWIVESRAPEPPQPPAAQPPAPPEPPAEEPPDDEPPARERKRLSPLVFFLLLVGSGAPFLFIAAFVGSVLDEIGRTIFWALYSGEGASFNEMVISGIPLLVGVAGAATVAREALHADDKTFGTQAALLLIALMLAIAGLLASRAV